MSGLPGSVAITGRQAIVRGNVVSAPGAGSISITGREAQVSAIRNPVVEGGQGSVTITGRAAVVVSTVQLSSAGKAELVTTGFAGNVGAGVTAQPANTNVAVTGRQGQVSSSAMVAAGRGSLSMVGLSGLVRVDVAITGGVGALSIQGRQGDWYAVRENLPAVRARTYRVARSNRLAKAKASRRTARFRP